MYFGTRIEDFCYVLILREKFYVHRRSPYKVYLISAILFFNYHNRVRSCVVPMTRALSVKVQGNVSIDIGFISRDAVIGMKNKSARG